MTADPLRWGFCLIAVAALAYAAAHAIANSFRRRLTVDQEDRPVRYLGGAMVLALTGVWI